MQPYFVQDPTSVVGGPTGRLLVTAPSFRAVRVVQRRLVVGTRYAVIDRVIMEADLSNFNKIPLENSSLQSALLELKQFMLNHGASPEAVQLFHGVMPFTTKELNIMATKLARKPAATKTTAAAKKAPARKAPAKAKATPAKAKATPAEAFEDTRKIKVLKKEHGAREGTKRAAMLDSIYASKTAQEALDAGVAKGEIAWAAREEYISLT